MERHTVRQAVPSWRARPWTEACSRRSWLIAHRHARAVRSARGLARASCCSVNTPAAHIGSAQRQVRFRQTSSTGGLARVLPPHLPAPGAAVTPDRDQQRRRPPPERLVREPPHHSPADRPPAAAAAAPPVRLHDPADQDRPAGFQPLPDRL